jgi:hypothetical protein
MRGGECEDNAEECRQYFVHCAYPHQLYIISIHTSCHQKTPTQAHARHEQVIARLMQATYKAVVRYWGGSFPIRGEM